MKKNDKIAAAIVLRGVAKDGKFAVDGAGDNDKALGEGGALKDVTAAGESEDNKAAGKLFGAGGGDAAAGDIAKAAAAVSAVSGEQIL
ncbi:variable large family protein, partial [Borreliella garinii]|uniref:variable large family protein n=1 Tax=Borreliella garinii TaxID=29519 RepID=UPI001AEE8E6B